MTALASHPIHACPDFRAWLLAMAERGGIAFAANASHNDVSDQTVDVPALQSLDANDVRLARSGDQEAFERIVRRYQQEVAKRLYKFARHPLDLEALVQETFVQAFLSLRGYRGDAPLVHWLHRIAVRVGYRWWRERRSRPAHAELDAGTLPVPARIDVLELHDVLEQLAPRDRLVLTLVYLEGHSVDQAALLTGWSRTMVKVQAFRARGRLRRLMEGLACGDSR
jgi:RNA polymerase sigma-70 factor, ECF subfamily